MPQILALPPLTTLNEYISAERRNRFIAAKIKKMNTEIVTAIAKSTLKPLESVSSVVFRFYMLTSRSDKDNLIFSQKFIWDGLVNAGIIPNDSWKFTPPTYTFMFAKVKTNPRIEVELE
jgi:Holliday junction resolvase RusA-like endonuclease